MRFFNEYLLLRPFYFFILLCLLMPSLSIGQVDLFTETFDEANGSINGTSAEGIAWQRDCPSCANTGYYEVSNGAFENNNTDQPGNWYTDPIDISACVRIVVSFDYSGDPFSGSGNLESNDECNIGGPCAGDPSLPAAGGCDNCWDFMHFNINVDGVTTEIGLIGTSNTSTSETFEYDVEDCAGVGNSAILSVACQTWAGAEFMRFDNVSLVCYDTGAVTGTLSGGGNLCNESCTTVDWEISGGVPPYTVNFTFNYGPFNFTFDVPSPNNTGSVNVCLDPDLPIPIYDSGSNTVFLNENFGNLATIEMNSVTDDAGCTVNLTGQIIDINIVDPPTINTIPDIEECVDATGQITIDLTIYEAAISGGANAVIWYDDPALTNDIGSSFTTSTNAIIYAVVDDGAGCLSDDIQVQILLTLTPILDFVADVAECDSYILPTITGTNITGDVSYFTMPGGTGTEYEVGDEITEDLTLYIYNEVNDCSDEIVFVITILPSPDIFSINSEVVCGYFVLPTIEGNPVSAGAIYYELPGGAGVSHNPGDTIFTNVVLYAYDILGTCTDEEFFTVLISQEPDFDMPAELSDCGFVILPDIDGENISSDAMYFDGASGTGTSYDPGDTIFVSQVIYVYDVQGDCMDEAIISITVSAGPLLTAISNVEACDFYILPMIDDNGSLIDPHYYSMTGGNGDSYNEGDTIFDSNTYYVYDEDPANAECNSEISFEVDIETDVTAGDDIDVNSCQGSIVSLIDLIDDLIDQDGTFIDIDVTGLLINDSIDLTSTALTQVTVLYEVSNICGLDTAEIVIAVVEETDAGDDLDFTICEGSLIVLPDYIMGDPGGLFFYPLDSDPIIGPIETDGMVGTTITVIYVVGDGLNCPEDEAMYHFEIIETPSFDAQPLIKACDAFILPILDGEGLDGSEVYSTEPHGEGTIYEAGDSIETSIKLYLYFESLNCIAHDSLVITIEYNNMELLTEQLCPGGSREVNGTIYDESLPSGSEVMKNVAGCDSTIVVNLSFYEIDTNKIENNLCFGQSITVNNTIYDETNPTGIEVLDGDAFTGCDSIIIVALTFSSASVTVVTDMICEGDSVLINDIYYSETNPSGMDTILLSSGCDSILDVNVSFLSSSLGSFDTTICNGSEFIYNGTIYNESNDFGTEVLSGENILGCDSLVDVSVSFFTILTGVLDTMICEEDEFVFNGTNYSMSNSSGEEILEGMSVLGCDSVVQVSVSFFEVSKGLITGEYCGGETIDILGVEFDEDNPEGEVVLLGASAQNCDSIVVVHLKFINALEGLRMESICEGSTVVIEGTLYSETSPTGFYIVQTPEGCDSTVNVSVSFSEVVVDFETGDPDCLGGMGGFMVFNGMNGVSSTFVYGLDGGDLVADLNVGDTIFNLGPGTHDVFFVDDLGCSTTVEIEILDTELPTVSVPNIVTIIEGTSYIASVDVDAGSTVLWTPDIGLSCDDCPDPEMSPLEDQEYIVTVTTADGCVATDTILIRVEQRFDIYVPNIFTPNEDGVNDRFFLNAEQDGIYDLFIFDRWGNLLFEGEKLTANNENQGWDGRFNGQSLGPGVYVYYYVYYKEFIDFEIPVEKIFGKGDITILR